MPCPLGSMDSKTAIGFAASAWLVVSFMLMARSIQKGRQLAQELAARHPDTYKALGHPRPGYFESIRRTRFAQFVGRGEFENLPDGALAARFRAYKRSEARLVIGILATGILVSLGAYMLRHAA